MPRNNRFLRRTLPWLVVTVALCFLSNKAAHVMARAGYFRSAGEPPSTSLESDASDPRSSPRLQPSRPDRVEAAMQKLKRLSDESMDLDSDWDGQAAVDRILGDLNADELAELYGRIEGLGNFGISVLSVKVGALWMAMDPDAALRGALAKSKASGTLFAMRIFARWAADHPREALAWLDAKGGDPALKQLQETFRSNLLAGMAERDFTLAEEELAKMDAKASADVMDRWGGTYVADAAMREKLVDYVKSTGRPGDFTALNNGLMSAWPENDPLGLLNHLQDLRGYLESDAIPVAARPETEAAAVGAAIQREYHEAALEWWMGRHAQSGETPQALSDAIHRWGTYKPDVAAQWLAEQPESPQKDALSAAAAPAFMKKERFPQAAEIIGGISDPGLRQLGIERLEILWKEADPAAAKAWKEGR